MTYAIYYLCIYLDELKKSTRNLTVAGPWAEV
jgi:hypothetical protein